jgi:hypothetical protein
MAKDSTIKTELKELSATVANLSGDTPFSLPSSYFEGFPQKIMERIENEALISNEHVLSSTLEGLKSRNPFKVPENYFDDFSVKLPSHQPAVISINFRKWASLAAAACLTGLILGIVFVNNKKESSPSLASTAISHEAMESYLSEAEAFELVDRDSELVALENNTLVDVSTLSISEMLKNIPDKDISGFLNLNGFDETATIN